MQSICLFMFIMFDWRRVCFGLRLFTSLFLDCCCLLGCFVVLVILVCCLFGDCWFVLLIVLVCSVVW